MAKWKVDNFENNQTFYTDSNGLEMQKRVLNRRAGYSFVYTNEKSQNISSNFYPVNSAITLIDQNFSKRILSVSNDRPQGASSLEPGSAEFIQNRRIPSSDGKGMDEWLIELDKNGRGVRVPATYYFQLGSLEQPRMQKNIQAKLDQPLQYFYNFAKPSQNSFNVFDFS